MKTPPFDATHARLMRQVLIDGQVRGRSVKPAQAALEAYVTGLLSLGCGLS